MTWLDDLSNLVGETAQSIPGAIGSGAQTIGRVVPQNTGEFLGELGRLTGNLATGGTMPTINSPGDVLGSIAARAGEIGLAPMHGVQRGIGEGVNFLEQHPLMGKNPDAATIAAIYDQYGGQGVSNYIIGNQIMPAQLAYNIITDPTTYFGAGLVAKSAKGLEAAAEAATTPAARIALQAAAKTLQAAEDAYHAPGGAVADVGHFVGGRLEAGINKFRPNWLKLTPQAQHNIAMDQLKNDLFNTEAGVEDINHRVGPQSANLAGPQQLPLTSQAQQANLFGGFGDQIDTNALDSWRHGNLPKIAHSQIVTPFDQNPEIAQRMLMPAAGEKPGSGITIHDVVSKHLGQARQDFAEAQQLQSIKAYDKNMKLSDRVQIAQAYDATHGTHIADSIKRWDNLTSPGTDPVFGNPVTAAVDAYGKVLAKESGIKPGKSNIFSLIRGMFGEMAFFSPRFHFNNWFGGTLQNAMEGVWAVNSPRDIVRGYELAQEGIADPATKDAIYLARHQMPQEQLANKFGTTMPAQVVKGGVTRSFGERQVSRSQTGELIGRLGLHTAPAEALGRIVGRPLWNSRMLGNGIETNLRAAPWAHAFENTMRQNFDSIDNAARVAGGDLNLASWMADPERVITPQAVYDELVGQGVKPGDATHVSRLVGQARNQAHDAGIKLAEQAQYSYNQTNLDAFIRNVVPFHYWLSRSLPRYTEFALRNPALPLAYFKEMQAAQDAQDNSGLDARQKHFIKLMGTPMGFTLLFNPEALWGVAQVYDSADTYAPDGQTTVGGALNSLKQLGLGTYPWIDGMLNLMGAEGDTWEPDFMPIPQKALFASVVNWMRSEGHQPMANTAPLSGAMGQLRQKISTLVAEVGAPDWFSRPVPAKAGNSTAQASFQIAMQNRIISNNTDANGNMTLTPAQITDAMTNPDNPEYQRAYQDMARAGVLQQLMNILQPVKFRIEDSQTDVRKAMKATITSEAAAKGVAPWEVAPTAGDIEFAARYRATTGRDWRPQDYEDSKFYQDLANAPDAAKQFILDDYAYTHMGTGENQTVYDQYQSLRSGSDPRTANMTPNERTQAAFQWADANHHTAVVGMIYRLQQSFLDTHPEYTAYKDWKNALQDWASGEPNGSLARYRDAASKASPNAAYFFQSKWNYIVAHEPDHDQRLHQMDQATTTPEAWMAVTGQAYSRYDTVPVPAAPNAAPADWTQQQLTAASKKISPLKTWGQIYGWDQTPTPNPVP